MSEGQSLSRAGMPAAAVLALLAFTFGVLARTAGWQAAEPIVFSALAFSGSGQLGALAILSVGGGVTAAVASAAFLNLRFLPMGVSVAPALSGGRLSRFAQAQALTDASWVAAARLDGTFDRRTLVANGAAQYAAWVLGTVAGACVGPRLISPEALGLDAVFPAFFLALLADQLRDREPGSRPRPVPLAALAGLLTLALVPVTPPGIPILAGAATALLALG
ncbi:MAG: AzlC family ABC transporter permease [Actinobacteria bacterium]|nr:AzlC family ABC transporter permease [Actinomycetota bacterium]